MNVKHLLKSRSKAFYFSFLILGLASSMVNMGVLLLINRALVSNVAKDIGPYSALIFFVLVGLSFACTGYFQKVLTRLTNDMIFELEISMIRTIRHASYESFEKLGQEKIYAAIGDAWILGRIPEVLVLLINAVVSILLALGYLLWISPWGALTILLFMTGLLLFYLYRNKQIAKDLNKVRDHQNSYYGSIRELINGFRQIKVSVRRNNNLFNDYILANRNTARTLSIRSARRYVVNQLLGTYSWYIILGVIVFVLPAVFTFSTVQTSTFIITVFFIMSPVASLIGVIPFYTNAKISLARISEIEQTLAVNAMPAMQQEPPVKEFNSIRFVDVVYQYQDAGRNNTFSLELADFNISRKEILFIVGGNGSGKTTFVNLLTGLYKPISGNVFIDGQEVSWEEFHAFSNSMAVVYANHYMFRENYDDHDFSGNNKDLYDLRKMLNLEAVLKIDSNKVDTKLSQGQQKRVALLLALLESKPIVILDEWAAEQDPYNRSQFYNHWLDEMKRRGKTVIAISHDDDFFAQADRVVKFNYGKIVSDGSMVQVTTA